MNDEKKSREGLSSYFEQIFKVAVPMYVIDIDYNMIKVSDAFCSYFQTIKDNVIGRKCFHILDGPACRKPTCSMANILQGRPGHEYEMDKKLPDGTEISYIVKSIPFKNPSGKTIGIIQNLTDITQRKQKEKQREIILHQMNDRVKELKCMFDLVESIRTRESLKEVFQDTANLLPRGWHYPEIARGRVVFDEVEYVSESFKETLWKQSNSIVVNGRARGYMEIFYMEERPELDEGPFMLDERKLINTLSKTISEAVEHRISRDELHTRIEEIERINKLFTGREYRILRMKQEVNRLLKELGQKKKYTSVAELEEHSGDEIGILSSSLNEMTDSLVKANTVSEKEVRARARHADQGQLQIAYNEIRKSRLAVLSIGEDLTMEIEERKKLQVLREKLITDLEHSNKDLEQFAYVASHDLQEPLRMVSSFTQLLAKRYKDQLDDDANEFINFAVDGANRMQRQITDLLLYSRIGSRGKPLLPVNSHSALEEAISNLSILIKDNHAIVTADDLPEVLADRSQLVTVFQNLIGNAIKFHGDEPPGISISVEKEGLDFHFRVDDNGIGLEDKYFSRIFTIFQRLHTAVDYPGTGIGLAICERIVTRHGGRIWVESEPGRGSVFHFTLKTAGE